MFVALVQVVIKCGQSSSEASQMIKLILVSSLLLSGCAHFDAMTQHEKNVVIGSTVAGLIIGAVVNDGGSNKHHHDCGHKKHHDCD